MVLPKAHKFRHIQRRTKTRILFFDSQSHTKINYFCSMHVFYSINKAVSIYSSIHFRYSAIAGSFESTESELKFFTMNLYHTQELFNSFPSCCFLNFVFPPSFLVPSASSAIKFFGPTAFWSYDHDRCSLRFQGLGVQASMPLFVSFGGKIFILGRSSLGPKMGGRQKIGRNGFYLRMIFFEKNSAFQKKVRI